MFFFYFILEECILVKNLVYLVATPSVKGVPPHRYQANKIK
ncbi:hypothetical protein EMIT019CA3_330012 [Bacillus pseudomycoides]|nr:hypothetical protein bmyco0002_55520 [Bacillus pseudomycoides]EEM07888.1 hypothetical protein bmyco0003_54250 [Bacillus pseudomycoides]